MARRKIVKIDEGKCNGCGLCVSSCAEGAIQVIDGKARLVSDTYCDGLGNCLGECPMDAITIEEREAADFDEAKAMEHVKRMAQKEEPACSGGCPGSRIQNLLREMQEEKREPAKAGPSALGNWPVQLKLVPVNAPYFENADILLAADCVPFAYPDFHRRFLQGKVLLIGCPKLDEVALYIEKLSEILRVNPIRSLTVVRMEVPCCGGLSRIARIALDQSGRDISFEDAIISIRGEELSATPA